MRQIPPLALTPWHADYIQIGSNSRMKWTRGAQYVAVILGTCLHVCVADRSRICVYACMCVYLCEGKRAFVFEVCGHRSMSVSIGRSFGRALGISIFSVALFLDARKKANNKNATEIASVCVWKCVHVCCLCLLYCSEVTDWQTDGLNGWPTDCQTDDIFDQQWHKVTCNTFCWGSDKQRLREWGSTSKDFRGLSLLT